MRESTRIVEALPRFGKMSLFSVKLALIFVFCHVVTSVQGKWINMNYVYDNKTLSFGTFTRYKQSLIFEGSPNKEVPYYVSYDLLLNEHSGTHIDAPAHFSKGKWTVEQNPIEKLIAPVVVVNMTGKASNDRNALLSVADLETWEKSYGRIPDNSVLLVHTGWDKYYPDEEKYFGTNTKNTSLYQFPGRFMLNNV